MPTYPYSLTLTNPGAETGDTTGWTNVKGTLVASTNGGGNSPRTGTYFFFAGTGLETEAYQDVTLPLELLTDVDLGKLSVEAIGYHSGFSDNDGGWIGIKFLDGSNRFLGIELRNSFAHNGINAWAERSVSGRIPENTRKVRLIQYGARGTGTNLDSYWDDFSLTVDRVPGSIHQKVSGCIYSDRFESIFSPPWTVISGTWTVVNAGIPNFFSYVKDTGSADNERAIYTNYDAQGTMVVQSQWNNITGTGAFAGVIARSDSTAQNNYLVLASTSTGNIQLYKQVTGTYTSLVTAAAGQAASTSFDFKGYFADNVQKVWIDGSLKIDHNDTTRNATTGYGGYRVGGSIAKEVRYDEYTICKSNTITCSRLPTGYKFRVTGPIVDNGSNVTKVATESSGTATVDCDNLWFPSNKVEVLDGSDNVVTELEQYVFGGDEYEYAVLDYNLEQTIVFNQIVGLLDLAPNVENILTLGQVVSLSFGARHPKQNITFIQTVDPIFTYSRPVSQTIVFNQVAEVTKVRIVDQSITFAQEIDVEQFKGVTQDLVFIQDVTKQYAPHNDRQGQQFEIIETVTVSRAFSKSLAQTFVLSQTATAKRIKHRTVTQALFIAQNATLTVQSSAENIITFGQSITTGKILHRTLTNNLIFNQIVTKTATFIRPIEQIIVFTNGKQKIVDDFVINIPGAQVTKIINRVTLKTNDSLVTLPRPMVGNTEKVMHEVFPKYSINNTQYTYTKRNTKRQLKYTFQVVKSKAAEVKEFYRDNSTKKIVLENWKGEVWYGYLINQFEVKVTNRWSNTERHEFTLEFEGVRVH